MQVSVGAGAPVEVTQDELFAGFDLSVVPTGFLKEYGFEYIDFSALDGSVQNDHYSDIYSLCQVVKSLQTMDVADTLQWYNTPVPVTNNSTIPVWIALYQYNQLSSAGYASGKMTYSNGVLTQSGSATLQDLYETKQIISFAPAQTVSNTNNVYFSFGLTDNCNLPITSIYFDADDGLGYRAVISNVAQNVTYNIPGQKTLRLKVNTADGEYVVKSYIAIQYSQEYEANQELASYYLTDFTTTYAGVNVRALLSYRAPITTPEERRVLLVVEGFDPHYARPLLGEDCIEDYGFNHISDFLMKAPEYDLFYVDWINSEADICANAQLLKQMIAYINDWKLQEEIVSTNVVIAMSMGGLIAQVAMREMENNHQTHQVEHFFSHDVPYCGVNIPIGAVYTYQSIISYFLSITAFNTFVPIIDNIISRYLYGDSVKQMSINYISPSGVMTTGTYRSFMSYLSSLGLPRGDEGKTIYNYTVSNGGVVSDYSQALAANSNHLFSMSLSGELSGILGFSASLLLIPTSTALIFNIFDGDFWANALTLLPGRAKVNYTVTVNPNTSSAGIVSSLTGQYQNVVLGFINVTRTFLDNTIYCPSIALNLDKYNGSYYAIEDIDAPVIQTDTGYDASVEVSAVDKIVFVPTYSSMRYPQGESIPNRNYRTQPLLRASCFDGYYLPGAAQEHTTNFPWSWMYTIVEDVRIDCADTLYRNDILTLNACFQYTGWSGVRNKIDIGQDGNVDCIYYETDAQITAYSYDDSTYVVRKKWVHLVPPEWPPIYMEPSLDPETGWTVLTLHSPDSLLDVRLQTYNIDRTWYSKTDFNALNQYHLKPIQYVISNLGPSANVQYMLQISAIVNDYENHRPPEYVNYTFWNNRRMDLTCPTAIVFNDDGVYMTTSSNMGYVPLGDDLILTYNESIPDSILDRRVSDEMIVVLDNGTCYGVELTDGIWAAPIFEDEWLVVELEAIMDNLEENEIGLIHVCVEQPEGGDPVQSYLIPVFRIENFD